MNDYESKWLKVLQVLKPEVNEVTFETWFEPLKFKSIDNNTNTLYILCDIQFAIDTINSRYMHLLEGCTEAIYHKKYKIKLLLASEEEELKKEEETVEISTTSTINEDFDQELIINPKYTFDNFVVGSNNEYAHAASLAVSENPAEMYNPLYLYGESGLGKTHLMHAISNHIFNNHLNMKVLYVTSEMFTNEIISAILNGKTKQFRDKYRQVDVLLIDDIQFFQDKDTIQEEVFNTFNYLYDNNKQIVISSDRPPAELVGLDERLRTRFGWNIVADIKKPTYETRMAILKKKAEQENLYVDENIEIVFSMISERVQNNVRELEGAFTNLLGMSRMLGKEITPEFAKKTLTNIFSNQEKSINVESIKRTVSKYFQITVKDLEGKKRSRDIAFPRQVAMYLTRKYTDLSLPKIGKAFGGKDHTTVLHACDKIANEIKTQESTKLSVEEIEERIKL